MLIDRIYLRNYRVFEDELELLLPPGLVGVFGPNGAGKSTTMRILTGYLPATSGHVSICGFPVALDPDGHRLRVFVPAERQVPERDVALESSTL